jgi:hypothetical protein
MLFAAQVAFTLPENHPEFERVRMLRAHGAAFDIGKPKSLVFSWRVGPFPLVPLLSGGFIASSTDKGVSQFVSSPTA